MLAAPLKAAAVVDAFGATTEPTAVPAGAAGAVVDVAPASAAAGAGVMVVVNGTTVLLEKGPSDTVTVWLGVAV